MLALILSLVAVLLVPSAAEAEVIVDDPAAHDALLAAEPGAGQPGLIDFEGMPFTTPIENQFLSEGVAFNSSTDIFPLPEAFGSEGNGARVAAVGFGLLDQGDLTFIFPEPQRAFATVFLDVGSAITVETFLDGEAQETFTLLAVAEDQDGGLFRGIWFDTFADEVHLITDAAEDGMGIDDFSVSAPGTVDNDLDGFAEVDGDCDDAEPLVNPGVADVCADGIDNNCDGFIDVGTDVDEDGVDSCIDCDDDDADVRPGVDEICDDGIDNDCSGFLDDAPDADGDGFGPCDNDCDDTTTAVFPDATELCDGVDNDCDGEIDESPDADGDTFTVCDGDCDDADPEVFPGQGCDDPPGDDDDFGDAPNIVSRLPPSVRLALADARREGRAGRSERRRARSRSSGSHPRTDRGDRCRHARAAGRSSGPARRPMACWSRVLPSWCWPAC